MDAVWAIMANGGRAIIFIFRDADRNKLISYSLYKFIQNPSTSATSNPLRRGSRGWGVFIYGNHAARRENGTSWWGCLCDVCFASKKSSEREFFVPAGTHLAVKLLKILSISKQTSVNVKRLTRPLSITPPIWPGIRADHGADSAAGHPPHKMPKLIHNN
jgi:hypothetical protein